MIAESAYTHAELVLVYPYNGNNSNTDNATANTNPSNKADAQKFKFEKQSDGTYVIRTKTSAYAKCIDAQPGSESNTENNYAVKQYTYTAGDEGQKWYLYPVVSNMDANGYISTSANYTIDKNQVLTITDQIGSMKQYWYYEEAYKTYLLKYETDERNNKTNYSYDNYGKLTQGTAKTKYNK